MANTLPNGTILNNQYEIIGKIAEGGFGIIYKARDRNNNRRVCAIKENLDDSRFAQEQFEREAGILKNLHHPNLPEYFAYFQEPDGTQFFAMEFIEGEDLDSKVKQANGPLPEQQVLTWILQVCDALSYIHSVPDPIIHRDIKPENIRITPSGSAMLVDFGIAKIYDPNRRTTLGARAFTAGYAPPEQYGAGKTDVRTDVYALGATLYRALTGIVPPESVNRPTGTPMQKPRQINAGLSQYIENIILQAMELDKSMRYQTIRDMADDMREVLAGAPTTITGIISHICQLTPPRSAAGYRRYAFQLYDQGTRQWKNCTFEGYMRPLTVLNQTLVTTKGIALGGDQFQVKTLKDVATDEIWIKKDTASVLDRFWAMFR